MFTVSNTSGWNRIWEYLLSNHFKEHVYILTVVCNITCSYIGLIVKCFKQGVCGAVRRRFLAFPGAPQINLWIHMRGPEGIVQEPWNGQMGHSGYRREGEGWELPGIATAALTHQDFNQSGILFIFTLELLDTQGKYLFFFSLRQVHLKQH